MQEFLGAVEAVSVHGLIEHIITVDKAVGHAAVGAFARAHLGGRLNIGLGVTVTGLTADADTPCIYGAVGAQCDNGIDAHVDIDDMTEIVVGILVGIGSGGSAIDHLLGHVAGLDGSLGILVAVIIVAGVTQVSIVSVAPGVDHAVPIQGQGYAVTGGHLDNILQIVLALSIRHDGAGALGQYPLGNAHGLVVTQTIAQLALIVGAPGVNIATLGNRQAVILTGGHSDDVGQVVHAVHSHLVAVVHAVAGTDLDEITPIHQDVIDHRIALIVNALDHALAQLAGGAKTPGPDSTVGPQHQGVSIAAVHLGRCFRRFVGIQDLHREYLGVDLAGGSVLQGNHHGSLAGAGLLRGLQGTGGAGAVHRYNGGIGSRHGPGEHVHIGQLVFAVKDGHTPVLPDIEVEVIQRMLTGRHRGAGAGGIRLLQDDGRSIGMNLGAGAVEHHAVLPDAHPDRLPLLGGAGIAHGAPVGLPKVVEIAVSADDAGVVVTGADGKSI